MILRTARLHNQLFGLWGIAVGQSLFRVADVFGLHRAGRVVIASDCPLRAAPPVRIGQPVEFRNPDGTMFRSAVAGVEIADPPDPERTLAFLLPLGTPVGAVQLGAEVWSLAEDAMPAEPLYGHIRMNKGSDSGRVSGDDDAS